MLKVLRARKHATGYRVVIQLDTSRPWQNSDGPIPDNLLVLEWGITPPLGRSVAQYETDIKREARLLAQEAAAKAVAPAPDAGTAFDTEGNTFSAKRKPKKQRTKR